MLTVCLALGQRPTIEWQNTIGGSEDDELYSLQQTSDGGYILGGYSKSPISGDKTEDSQGGSDYWVIKLGASGAIQWQNTIGGSSVEVIRSIQQTNDGGYILGGWSYSDISGDKTENSIGGADYWVVKLNALGAIEWQNTIGGSGSDILSAIDLTFDGGYILGGTSSSGSSADKTESTIGATDYWVVKIDSLGNIQWDNTIGGNWIDNLTAIQQTSDGGYILGGWSGSIASGDKSENNQGSWDYWVVKLDAFGVIQWENTIGGTDWEELYCISQTNDGGFILGGWSWSDIGGDKTENSWGQDMWVLKLTSFGVIEWQNTIGGSRSESLQSVQQTSDGGYILGGVSSSYRSGDKSQDSNGGLDYWLVKTDSLGIIQWDITVGGEWNDYLTSIQHTDDGGAVLGGYSKSGLTGDKTEDTQGGRDFWVVKLSPPIYVAPVGKPNEAFTLYPNPTTGKFRVSSSEFEVAVRVFDLLGREITDPEVTRTEQGRRVEGAGVKEVDLSAYPNGIYFVKVGERTSKLVLSR